MKPIKVLHITETVTDVPYINNLCDHTDPAEIEYSFVTFAPRAGFVEGVEKRGKTIYALNALERRRYPFVLRKLWRIMKSEDPDIVQTHLFNPTLVGVTFAKWQKRKIILTRHHSTALHDLPGKLKRNFYLMLEDYINKRCDHIIAPSRAVRDVLVKKENVPPEKVSVLPYGQITERFDNVTNEDVGKIRAELGMDKNLALVCVSRLYHGKGHKFLFEAFSDLSREGLDATLYLVGEGDYRSSLEALAKKFGIAARVRFLGWRDDVLTIIAAADIVVHPSLEDALSQSLIESLMFARPIVATDISGAADTLKDGEFGKLVPPADAVGFREALRETIADPDLARRKAAGGREYILEYMSAQRMADEYTKLYKKVLARS